MAKSAHVGIQFEDMEQQTRSATLGMWTFLSTEILFFGVLFVSYTMCRIRRHDAFRQGSLDLKLWIGGMNTAVLLTSSLFMALAVRAASLGNNRDLVVHLIITMLLGLAFLGFKAYEYSSEAREALVPEIKYSTIPPDEQNLPPAQQHPRPNEERLFMIFYFIMTGLHALHMVIGISVLAVLALLARRGHFTAEYHNPVEIAGLYWHFVDIVWVFLYPALYLLRQS